MNSASFKQITVNDMQKMLSSQKVTIVDIRNSQAFEQGHIKGATLIDDRSIDEFISSCDKSIPVVCYCYHGFSSQSAAAFLSEQGFKDVYSLIGGFEAWQTLTK